jgi:hypothetical protein
MHRRQYVLMLTTRALSAPSRVVNERRQLEHMSLIHVGIVRRRSCCVKLRPLVTDIPDAGPHNFDQLSQRDS